MKTACEVIGGPYEGTYLDDNWPSAYSEPMRGWASATANFTVGKSFRTMYPVAQEKAKGRGHSADRYEVVSRHEVEGVLHVRLEYRGAT
jgi:hypothetical protein